MKKHFLSACTFLFILLLINVIAIAQQLDGAWQLVKDGEPQTTRIIEDDYFMQAVYDKAGKKFESTHGGVCKADNGQLTETVEFNTADKESVGSSATHTYQLQSDQLTITRNGQEEIWRRIDDGKGALAGNWRITGREQDGKMNRMKAGDRKTLKILSGTFFQWAAINPATKEFFGTGGGTYTFENGKYTEQISFFSRDNSRVGMSLSFDGKVDGKSWHHSGLSSKGDKISEIWTRQ